MEKQQKEDSYKAWRTRTINGFKVIEEVPVISAEENERRMQEVARKLYIIGNKK